MSFTTKYVVKEGTMEWFSSDSSNNSRGVKSTADVKLIRHSDAGLKLIIPVESNNTCLEKEYELRRDNLGCLAIVKYASGSSFKRITTHEKKILIIMFKNQYQAWSTLVLSPKKSLPSDIDITAWKEEICKQLFQETYNEFLQLKSVKGKHDLHITPHFVSIVPSPGFALEGRENVLTLCDGLKNNIWSISSFLRNLQVRTDDQHELTITYPQQESMLYNLEGSNCHTGEIVELLHTRIRNHGRNPSLDNLPNIPGSDNTMVRSRDATDSPDPVYAKRAPEPLPRPRKISPSGCKGCAPSDILAPPYFLTPAELHQEIPPPAPPPASSSRSPNKPKPPLERQPTVYSQLIRNGEFNDEKYYEKKQRVVMRAKEVKEKPVSQRVTQLLTEVGSDFTPIHPLPRNKGIDDEFEEIYTYMKVQRMRAASRGAVDSTDLSIDVTIYKIFKDGEHKTLNSLGKCPLGLGDKRLKLVLRLELCDWQMFAYHVFGDMLPHEEMKIIEEIGIRYGPPAVEILLTHWKRVYKLNPRLPPPTAESIAAILRKMELLDLLDQLGWADI